MTLFDSKLNFTFYTDLTAQQDAEKAQQQKQRYEAERPEAMERQAKLDFNTALVGTPDQIKKIRSWGRNLKQHLILIHIIGCTTIADNRVRKEINQRVPIPYTFLDEFRLREDIADLVERGVLEKLEHENKGHHKKGRCARYRLAKDKYKQYTAKAEKSLRKAKFALEVLAPKWSALLDRRHQRLDSDTIEEATEQTVTVHNEATDTTPTDPTNTQQTKEAKVSKPKRRTAKKVKGYTGERLQQNQPLIVNIKALHTKLEQQRLEIDSDKDWDSYQHTARCVALIQAQVGKADKHGLASYRPQYIQTDEHLRRYEVGGGYQGLPKEYKAVALTGTGQTNADFKAAHPTIFHQISMYVFGDSPLTNVVKGDYPTIGTLTRKYVKKIVCATINGCRVGKTLVKHKYAIANICRENGGTHQEIQVNINKAVQEVTDLAQRVKAIEEHWVGLNPDNNKGRATMSELYQTIEQNALRQVTGNKHAANEHDGWVDGYQNGTKGQVQIYTKEYANITLEWEAEHYKKQHKEQKTKITKVGNEEIGLTEYKGIYSTCGDNRSFYGC